MKCINVDTKHRCTTETAHAERGNSLDAAVKIITVWRNIAYQKIKPLKSLQVLTCTFVQQSNTYFTSSDTCVTKIIQFKSDLNVNRILKATLRYSVDTLNTVFRSQNIRLHEHLLFLLQPLDGTTNFCKNDDRRRREDGVGDFCCFCANTHGTLRVQTGRV